MNARDSAVNSGLRLIAHRGYAARYPENTRESLAAAVEAGARYIEFDVQLTPGTFAAPPSPCECWPQKACFRAWACPGPRGSRCPAVAGGTT